MSTAIEIACRSLRARAAPAPPCAPPTTGSSQLKPTYSSEVATEVRRSMPRRRISGVSAASPPADTRTAWSKLSEPMPELS
jgi:hypothetical protein